MRSLVVLALLALGATRAAATPAPHARSRIIYLNRDGATLSPGVNDSRAQRSSIIAERVAIPPWLADDAQWAATVACMRDIWSRFDVEITDVDPGPVDHLEAILGGTPSDAGLPADVTGAAPQAADCSVVENGIALTFTAILPADPRQICEVTSHELGHLYGLDHELLAADPMSYLPVSGEREFQDVDAACGETTARRCACGDTQNSAQLLFARLGAAGEDETAPVVTVLAPGDGAEVDPGFEVAIAASDNASVATLTVSIDDVDVMTTTDATLTFAAPDALSSGPHVVRALATDPSGNVSARVIQVIIAAPADGGCSTASRRPTWGAAVCGLVLTCLRRRSRRERLRPRRRQGDHGR